ncbi:MAG: O-antigen ligase family protein [bacterium]|nr:O-antigen ligase family protein [bacterium]
MVDTGIIIFFILFTALSLWRLHWGLTLIIYALPLYIIRFSLGPIPSTLLEGMILIVTVAWLVKKRGEFFKNIRGIFSDHPKTLILIGGILFLISASVSVIVSPDTRAALGILRAYFLEPFLFFLVFTSTVNTEKRLYATLVASILSALSIASVAVYQKIFLQQDRVISLFPYPNAVGLYIAPIIPFLIGYVAYFSSRVSGWKRTWLYIAGVCSFSLLVSAIIFSQTESALIALFITFFGWALCANTWTRRQAIRVGISVILLVSISQPLQGFLQEKLLLKDWSGFVRRTVWEESIVMLQNIPITGAGLSGYQQAFEPYHTKKFIEIFLYPHNIILNFLSETGLYGLVAFFLLWIASIILLIKTVTHIRGSGDDRGRFMRYGAQATLASYAVIAIHGLVDVPYFKNDLSVFFWGLIGVSVILYTMSRSYGKTS